MTDFNTILRCFNALKSQILPPKISIFLTKAFPIIKIKYLVMKLYKQNSNSCIYFVLLSHPSEI